MLNAVYRKLHLQPVQHRCLSLCGVSTPIQFQWKHISFLLFPFACSVLFSFVNFVAHKIVRFSWEFRTLLFVSTSVWLQVSWVRCKTCMGSLLQCSLQLPNLHAKIFACFVRTSRYFSRTQKKQLTEEEIVKLATEPVSKVRVGRYAGSAFKSRNLTSTQNSLV